MPIPHSRAKSQETISRRDAPSGSRRAGNFHNAGGARVFAFSAMCALKKARRRHIQLDVPTEELGSWPYRWNESPLIGIVLLLALAPDGQLAAKCAAACLMAEGGRDNLHRSISWRDIKTEAALGDLHKGCVQSAIEMSHRRAPVVVRDTRMPAASGGGVLSALAGHCLCGFRLASISDSNLLRRRC